MGKPTMYALVFESAGYLREISEQLEMLNKTATHQLQLLEEHEARLKQLEVKLDGLR